MESLPKIRIDPAYSGGLLHLDPNNWPVPVVFDIDGLQDKPQIVPIIRDHDQGKKCGQTTRIEYDEGKIVADGELLNYGIDEAADKVAELAKRGAKLQASVATGIINPEDVEYIDEGREVEVNGKPFVGPIEVVRRWKLKEISIVTVGADDEGTSVTIANAARSERIIAPRARKGVRVKDNFFQRLKKRIGAAANATEEEILNEVETAVKEAAKIEEEERKQEQEHTAALAAFAADVLEVEIDPEEELTEKEKTILEAAYKKYCAADGEPSDEEKPKQCQAEDPTETEDSEQPPAMDEEEDEGKGMKTGAAAYSRTMYPARLLGRFNKYAGRGGSGGAPNPARVAEAALMTANGTQEATLKALGYTSGEIDEATRRENRNLTLKGLLYRTGAAAPGMDDAVSIGEKLSLAATRARLRGTSAYRSAAAAGQLSTIDIPGVLANVMYKSLLNGLQTVEDPTDKISRVVNARDFRDQSFVNLLTSGDFSEVGDNGELESLKLSDASYTNRAKMRGFELRIGYEAIANDDMNALQEIPKIMGRKAALRKQRIFFEALANAAGVASVSTNPTLTLTGLDKAAAAFRALKDGDGDPVGAKPRFLIVPPALEQTAYNLTAAANIVQGTTGDNAALTIVPQTGRYAARLEVVTSEYLGADGYLAKVWGDKKYMLLADPADVPLMILSYYQNQNTPQLKTVYGDVDIEGLRFVCYWGFGVSVAETRGAVVSNPT